MMIICDIWVHDSFEHLFRFRSYLLLILLFLLKSPQKSSPIRYYYRYCFFSVAGLTSDSVISRSHCNRSTCLWNESFTKNEQFRFIFVHRASPCYGRYYSLVITNIGELTATNDYSRIREYNFYVFQRPRLFFYDI